MRRSTRGQALVELALILPVMIMLALLVLDVGRLFAAWVSVNNAAREGAYTAAGRFVGATADQTVKDVVSAEGSTTINNSDITVTYPQSDIIHVVASSSFQPFTPMAQFMLGGSAFQLSATSDFRVPVTTPVPTSITPTDPTSTPTLTPTATSTATPLPTATATATRTSTPIPPTSTATPIPPTATPIPPTATRTPVPAQCTVAVSIPAITASHGYYVVFTSAGSGVITMTWTIAPKHMISMWVYSGTALTGVNPSASAPPSSQIATSSGNVTSLTVTTPSEPAGTYTAYFYNAMGGTIAASNGTIRYVKATCP